MVGCGEKQHCYFAFSLLNKLALPPKKESMQFTSSTPFSPFLLQAVVSFLFVAKVVFSIQLVVALARFVNSSTKSTLVSLTLIRRHFGKAIDLSL